MPHLPTKLFAATLVFGFALLAMGYAKARAAAYSKQPHHTRGRQSGPPGREGASPLSLLGAPL
jgi:hypothetical protein